MMHKWGVQGRTEVGACATVNYSALLAEYDFLQRSFFLRVYLMCFSTTALMRSATTVVDLANIVTALEQDNVVAVGQGFISATSCRLLDMTIMSFAPDVLFPLKCKCLNTDCKICLTHIHTGRPTRGIVASLRDISA